MVENVDGNDYMSSIEIDRYVQYAQQYEQQIGENFQSSNEKEE